MTNYDAPNSEDLDVPAYLRSGVKLEEEIIERGVRSGSINFFERWSRKKQVHNKMKS